MTGFLRQDYPDIAIYTRGYDKEDCYQLLKASTTISLSKTLEPSLQADGEVPTAMDVFKDDAADLNGSFQTEYYG